MSLSIAVILLLIPAIVWLIVSIMQDKPKTPDFWFQGVVIVAILFTFGLIH
jgi:hypothetical protein